MTLKHMLLFKHIFWQLGNGRATSKKIDHAGVCVRTALEQNDKKMVGLKCSFCVSRLFSHYG